MIVIGGAVLFIAVGVAMILARRYLAGAQSQLAGGTIAPGCIVAEAVVFFVLAVVVVTAWRAGLLALD